MSTSAFAQRLSLDDVGLTRARAHRKTRRATASLVTVPWNTVAIADDIAAGGYSVSKQLGRFKRPPGYVWGLFIAAIVIHALFAWYVSTHAGSHTPKVKHEVAVELIRPKPPEPKIEPPKPLPPKPQPVQKQAQVLPPIQTPAPQPSDSPAQTSSEPPVAVAPIVSAAPPVEAPPAPITPPLGRAGYLNNPPPNYPPAAARASWQGTVKLHVHVLASGKPDIVDVQQTSGRKVLDDEAVRTVKTWTFTPAKRGEAEIDGWANVPIEFKLEQ